MHEPVRGFNIGSQKRLLTRAARERRHRRERRSKNFDTSHLMVAVRIVPAILPWWNCPLGQWRHLRLALAMRFRLHQQRAVTGTASPPKAGWPKPKLGQRGLR